MFKSIPEYIYIILCEDAFDKRSPVYKSFTANGGMSVEFAYRTPGDIKAWVTKILASSKKQMESSALNEFLDAVGTSMYNVISQLDKLLAMCSDKKIITAEDVKLIVSRELGTKEYNLTDALLRQDSLSSFRVLLELEQMKTEPVRLLYIIASSFLSTYKARVLLSAGMGQGEVLNALGMPSPFLGKKVIKAALNTNEEFLKNAIANLRDADYKIKIGDIEPYTCIKLVCSAILENKKFS